MDEKSKLAVQVFSFDKFLDDWLLPLNKFVKELAGLDSLEIVREPRKPKLCAWIIHPEFEAAVLLAGLIDATAEIARLQKQIGDKRKALDGTKAKLSNEKFVSGAPPEVVQQQRDLVIDIEKQIATGRIKGERNDVDNQIKLIVIGDRGAHRTRKDLCKIGSSVGRKVCAQTVRRCRRCP